jgi:chaperone modulatory protein CbpM
MKKDSLKLLSGDLLEEDVELSLAQICRACRLSAEQIVELVDQGVIEPSGREPVSWRFQGISLRRVHFTQRMQRDLGVNAPGAALALDLLEELEQLRSRLRRFEK